MGRYKGSKDGMRTLVEIICQFCGKHYKVFPAFRNRKFCSRKCHYKFKIGKKPSQATREKMSKAHKGKHCGSKNSQWKGGKYKAHGYIFIHCPNHPFRETKRYIKNARFIMEKYLGRYLTPKEVVHHINGIKDDDRIENLMLFPNDSKHHKLHHRNRKKSISHK